VLADFAGHFAHLGAGMADSFPGVGGPLLAVHASDRLDNSLMHVPDPLSALLGDLVHRFSLGLLKAEFFGG